MTLDDLPEEPHFRSELSVLSPASPKPIHFPAPTNIPVLNNMMDVEYNQTELHMQNPAMRNTEVRDGAWKETETETMTENAGESSIADVPPSEQEQSTATTENTLGAEPEHVPLVNSTTAIVAQPEVPVPSMGHVEAYESASHQVPTETAATQQSDVNHGQTAASLGDDASQHAPAPQHEIATDADTFLSQIQNVAVPSASTLPGTAQADAAVSDTSATSPAIPVEAAQELVNTAIPEAAAPSNAISNIPNAISLQSLFPSGALPADLAASLMQGASLPSAGNVPIPFQIPKSVTPLESRREQKLAAGEILTSDDERWTADIQHKYDEFIQDERRYVNEGRWDSFPHGSRLFVGNLSSESVTKRDIFHVFHSYGRLAQISIKQAFGFVQFLNSEDCARALEGEQGRQIKDKKIHLEISKPQKSRNQGNQRERRSRSPENRNPTRADRYSGGARNDRDGHRAGHRSPSPRGGYRDRYDDRYRNRSRTPPGFSRNRHYGRSPSPRARDPDEELPLPRRAPQDIPEVQVIVVDELDRDFIGWVEKAFAARGIRVAVLLLSPRLDEQAVVRRQIIEGVLAVTKLTRTSQMTRRIDLQVFDRRGGQSNVRFDEYSNLDPATCAELVLRARSTHAAPAPVQYGYNAPPSYIPPSAPPQYGYAPPPVTTQYSAAPAYAPPFAAAPQFPYPPPNPYGAMKAVPQGSAPPQMAPSGYSPYGPPALAQPVSFPMSPGNMPPLTQQQQQASSSAGAPQAGAVDMQQILARLGSYNK